MQSAISITIETAQNSASFTDLGRAASYLRYSCGVLFIRNARELQEMFDLCDKSGTYPYQPTTNTTITWETL